MDPFSITAGVLGITSFAAGSISELRTTLNNIAEAEDVVRGISSSLDAIQRPLSSLSQISISDETTFNATKKDLDAAGVAEAVNQCGAACDKFSRNVKNWTRHSQPGALSFRDRFAVGLWNQEKIRTFEARVKSCVAIVQLATTSAQL